MRLPLLLCALGILLIGCSRNEHKDYIDRPQLTPNVTMHDVVFSSAALSRNMQYRVVLPSKLPVGQKLPAVYLLHGGAGTFRDWSNYSDVAKYAERGFVLIMPEGDDSYYVNSREHPQDRYEDYIIDDLTSDVESKFPIESNRTARAIVGVSMGGYGAVKLSLSHPDKFVFAAGISSAVDVPSRPFSIMRISQWQHHRSIFGDWGTVTRRNGDPFYLARKVDPAAAPYFFLTCGDKEGLLPSNRSFAELLHQRKVRYEFHVVPGGHSWSQWDEQIPAVFKSLMEHTHSAGS
jgi:putative tributyrin esterase